MTDTPPTIEPFRADNPFRRIMANGHLNRTGHTLVGHYRHNCDGLSTLIRSCC